MAVLTVGIFSVLSTIPVLYGARKLAVELVIARQIADSFAERIQGAAWSDLGGNLTLVPNENAWSLPRYNSATQPVNEPLSESATDTKNNIFSVGMLSQPSGMANLKIYLEYYTGEILKDPAIPINDRKAFYDAISGTAGLNNRRLKNGQAIVFDSTSAGTAVIIRIIVTWNETVLNQPKDRHELFVMRRM